MNKEEFENELKKIGVNITKKQLDQFQEYVDYLLEYNEKTNLTAIKTEDQVYLKHFYDSATLTRIVDFTKINTMLDIGSGAGFPGIVIKILFPNIEITLLDSNNKKTKFLTSLKEKLKLEKINIVNERAEDYCSKHRESFDVVTARAVSYLTVLCELGIPFVKVDGYFAAMKGSDPYEIEESKYAIEELGGKLLKIDTFELPIEESTRNLVLVQKVSNTKEIYPRRYDKVVKNPLKKR